MELLLPVIIVFGVSLVFGLLLCIASVVMAVKTDKREALVLEILPGANCGGCGYAGCADYARCIVHEDAPINKCTAVSQEVIDAIAEILGKESVKLEPQFAVPMCLGSNELAKNKYNYQGINSCSAAFNFVSGQKACAYGCLGFGDCVEACQFNAIKIIDGVARVDKTLCTGCGACVAKCPKRIIKLVPKSSTTYVMCSSISMGKAVMPVCEVGCIGCKRCEKACPSSAITVENNLAKIDYSKCTNCGECALVCPRHCIIFAGDK
ncbi:MAG: RnfABCDGE type electron transport complex subunit B [Eubacteriales bacterium]